MSAISLRLPDDFDTRLEEEARLEGKTRSEIARQAIAEFLERREKERFMAEMVAAAQALAADPAARREALELANDLVDEGLDAIIASEIAAGINPDEKWWR
ncbi:MAG: CopG family transcriptional regulator [bacterium]|nr:MAG: CopG family transcriptional regulator [bacterium]KAF0149673.1 MAG: CopG family transcriptional regulator [bacterium]KAF0169339.1 MAG: CopG family transcriptional regulator [bacterium]TXT21387.1 MAG: CopG family transcriptional regulator [bacterium]